MNEWRSHSLKKLSEVVPAKGTAKVTRWPTRFQRRMNEAGEDQRLREKAEKDERMRWIRELKYLLEDGAFPAVASGAGSLELSRRFGKGRRANTLRKHVETWKKLSDWIFATFRHAWPENAGEVTAYLESRADEPSGRSVPSSIFKTLMFMESTAKQGSHLGRGEHGVDGEEWRIHQEGLWHIPVSIVKAWEDMVFDKQAKEYVRCYAWHRRVKLWTGMRYSDTCGMLESTLELHRYGLTAVLAKFNT